MANTNPQAVRIANEGFRRLADKLAQSLLFSRNLREKILAEGIEALFADKDVIFSSADDNRAPMSNEDVKAAINDLDRIIEFFDSNPDLRDRQLRLSVNPTQF